MTYRNAIVVGASSGIGEALARRLAAAGTHVALLARRKKDLDRIAADIRSAGGRADAYAHDVRTYDQAPVLLTEILKSFDGTLDLVVYASGVMPLIEENEYDFEKDRMTLEVNVLGAFAWLNPVAALLEKQGRGTIIGISSIAGERGRMGFPAYCTSKAAFTTYLESLRNRLHRQGCSVVTVKPGYIETPMTKDVEGMFWQISADECARRILAKAAKRSVSFFVPWRWGVVAFVLKRIPSFLFRWTKV